MLRDMIPYEYKCCMCVCACACSSHMQDLKDVTKEVHYENYRAKYITERLGKRGGPGDKKYADCSLLAAFPPRISIFN